MSRKHRKLRRSQNELTHFGPVPVNNSRIRAIENWLLYGDEAGREAVQHLFPVKGCQCVMCRPEFDHKLT